MHSTEGMSDRSDAHFDALIWFPGSNLIITGDNTGQISSWNFADGKVVHTYKPLDPTVVSRTWALTSTPDGAFLAAGFFASGSPEKLVQVWEIPEWKAPLPVDSKDSRKSQYFEKLSLRHDCNGKNGWKECRIAVKRNS